MPNRRATHAHPSISHHLERLRLKLGNQKQPPIPKGKAAAVLLPIFERGGEGHVLYIKRSEQVSHQGQVAFPGGRVEPTDSDLGATALREAHEEVGIVPETVEMLGFLPSQNTLVSGYFVAPFVGAIPDPRDLSHDPREVAEVFTVPLDALFDPKYRGTYEFRRDRREFKFPAILYAGQTIWGLTYRITLDLIEILNEPRNAAGG
jgi:8-oxo-dGTP pyrophosphatase MutT (NUDIX family)